MPSSQWWQIPKIIEVIRIVDPESIPDIGVGFGKYGFLAREYLEIWEWNEYCKFKRRIDGIEACGAYITPIHKFIYDNLLIGDATKHIDKVGNYDLVLLIDVLEHIDKGVGKQFLERLTRKSRFILISTPNHFFNQGSVFGNQYEIHRSKWNYRELKHLAKPPRMAYFHIPDSQSIILLLGERVGIMEIKKKIIKLTLKNLVAKVPFTSKVYRIVKVLVRSKKG